MKLPNFRNDTGLNSLRLIIGAELNKDYKPESSWDPMILKLIQEGELGNLKLSDVSIADNGTLEYGGFKVVVYIRDQRKDLYDYSTGKSKYKYHFYNCNTICDYRETGKYDGKYVVNTHKKFNVNLVDYGILVEENLELDLNVCKGCLKGFHYKGYKDYRGYEEAKIYKDFSRKEYFSNFKSQVTMPKYNFLNKPLDVYVDDWSTISQKAKERANYKCENTGCNSDSKLQTHHINHNKRDNSINNLKVLCYECHKKHHSHMH